MLDLENKLVPINLRARTIQTGPQTGLRIMLRGGAGIEAAVWWQYQIQDFRYDVVERFLTLSASYRQRDLEPVVPHLSVVATHAVPVEHRLHFTGEAEPAHRTVPRQMIG